MRVVIVEGIELRDFEFDDGYTTTTTTGPSSILAPSPVSTVQLVNLQRVSPYAGDPVALSEPGESRAESPFFCRGPRPFRLSDKAYSNLSFLYEMEDMQFTPVCFLDTKKEKRKDKKGSGSNKVKATWNDSKHALFIRICLKQMRLGNRHSHTLNKEGYINLEKEFLRESGLHYNQLQFKNHWDSTRRDWKAWTALRNSTDVAWDTNKNTYSQTAEWWADFSLKYPGAAKFADQPLTHVEELDQLFGDGFEKGELVAVPILGNTIHKYITDSENEIMVDDEDKESDALEENETTSTPTGSTNVPPSPLCSAGCSSTPIGPSRAGGPTPAQPLKHREPLPSIPRPEKRAKRVASVKWEASLKQICELLAERTKRLASFATEDSNPISNAMDLLNEVTEIERNSDEWLFTASLLRDQSNRQLFVALGNPGSRLAWIRREYRLAHH